MTTTDLRNYVILPATPEQAKLVGLKLVEMGDKVYGLSDFKFFFKEFPAIWYNHRENIWIQRRLEELSDITVITYEDFLSGKLPLSKAEYWEKRCRLSEAVNLVPNTVDYEDLDDREKAILDTYKDFLANNPEPK